MVSISHIVSKLVNEKIYLYEAISKKIASYGSVARQLKPQIEQELGREVDHSAIVTALRRFADKINTKSKDIKFNSKYAEVNLKTHIIDINVLKTQELFDKLKRFYDVVDFERGDILHVIYGRTHVAIVTNDATYDKMIANIGEVKARGPQVIAIAEENDTEIEKHADYVLRFPSNSGILSCISISVILQLLSYHVANLRGCSIDKPRNLAKSVTVE